MIRRALLAIVVGSVCSPATAGPPGLAIWVEVDGSSYLWNPTLLPISFDGYQIASETNQLDPAGWRSIADAVMEDTNSVLAGLGAGALTFGEATPGAGNLAELNLGGAATLQPDAKWFIGAPFESLPPGRDLIFFYKIPGQTDAPPGEIVYAPDTPEPSTFLLAALAGLGLLVVRRRGLRVSPYRPQ